ncbi:cation efflux protein/ zinc transporter-like protein, partial [Leptotrombidium deliense]
PSHIDIEALKIQLKTQIQEIIEIHELHIWQLTSDKIIGTIHIMCKDSEDYEKIVPKMKRIFHELKVHSTTIQPEFTNSKLKLHENECLIECPSPENCINCCPTENEEYDS